MSLKQLKEQFVSDLSGGSVQEIYTVTGTALAALVAHTCVQRWVVPKVPVLSKFPISFIVAFYFDVMIQLQAITILSGQVSKLYYTAGAISLVAFLLQCINAGYSPQRQASKLGKSVKPEKSAKNSKSSKLGSKSHTLGPDILGHIPYITAYRSQMMVITNLAILAVDFHIFPRRFAKVETWGTSMMDLGVGSFVFSMGLANSRAVIKKQLLQAQKQGSSEKKESYWSLIWTNTVKALPVLSLGLIRLVTVKSLEYQEHVTEYGVHWNFFMTLGLLPIFMGILDPLFSVLPRSIVALLVGVSYEVLLGRGGLGKFVLDETNRTQSIISLNKEGLASFIGYSSIFIFGQSFGSFVLTTKKTPNNLIGIGFGRPRSWLTVSSTQGLVIATAVSLGLFWASTEVFVLYQNTISRRLANLPYVLWVVSYNAVMLLCYNVSERIFGPIDSKILGAINKNGLAIFLAANIGTGLVNTTMNTLEASNGMAYSVLILYALTWVALAVVLDRKQIYIKL